MPTRVRSFSKINLGLAIGPVRSDGFHELVTLYQTLAAHDLVTIAATPLGSGEPSSIELQCADTRVPLDERNTVWKMLSLALHYPPYAEHGWAVSVDIDKRLPVQGGLGAGSANAAAALLGLEHETGLSLPGGDRLRVAAEVGSDVPLFLIGGAVLGLGRGEEVYPMPDLLSKWSAAEIVLALPNVGVSTPQAFRDWDALASSRSPEGRRAGCEGGEADASEAALPPAPSTTLTGTHDSDRLKELSRALAAALCEPQTSSGVFPSIDGEDLARQPLAALVRTGIRNDFEEVVFRLHPLLGTIKRVLLGLDEAAGGEIASICSSHGAVYAALSGSGSALFGVYPDADGASQAEARLAKLGVQSLRTRMLRRAEYWEQALGTRL